VIEREIGRAEGDGDQFSGGSVPVELEDTISGRSSGSGAESSPVSQGCNFLVEL
jgi:hypothetical protein